MDSIVFNAGASGYTITPNPTHTLTLSGAGILNDSFRHLLNDDAMATEKTAERIRKFAADIVKLEKDVASKL